jgi:O-antigen ligase
VGFGYLVVRRYRVILLFVPFLVLGLFFLPGDFAGRALQGDSFAERRVGWSQNFQQVEEVLGNGIGEVGAAAEKTMKTLNTTDFFYQPDNQYFKIVYELGLFGLLMFVLVLVYSVLEVRKVLPKLSGVDLAFAEGVNAHFISVFVACISANYFEIFPMDFFYWLLLGVVLTCRRDSS